MCCFNVNFLNVFLFLPHMKSSLISLISEGIKGLYSFTSDYSSSLKIFLFNFLITKPYKRKFVGFSNNFGLCSERIKRKWYMYKKVYWFIGINISESSIAHYAAAMFLISFHICIASTI